MALDQREGHVDPRGDAGAGGDRTIVHEQTVGEHFGTGEAALEVVHLLAEAAGPAPKFAAVVCEDINRSQISGR